MTIMKNCFTKLEKLDKKYYKVLRKYQLKLILTKMQSNIVRILAFIKLLRANYYKFLNLSKALLYIVDQQQGLEKSHLSA
jgi:hypothetical protein